ncbi:DUF7114 family protein [Halorussus amylolyticus]|uniref:DUF7114 family protein n=1 Tax=Halorussus amylolyticus TaxID=1126242 RepID=UPI0010491BC5|nr:hypothetical protein [Halorussus amylolyticus]
MEAAVRARNAGRRAVRDVAPDPLRERIHALLDDSAMVPGVLALSSARAVGGPHGTDGGSIDDRAAGVQLIYEGLRLTRALAHDRPWERDLPHTDSNIGILAADVMVARGFSLLASTEAADKAVETVKSFGRDQTDGQQGRTTSPHALEADVFELAVLAGTTAFGVEPSDSLVAYAADLADSLGDDCPEPPDSLPEEVAQAMADVPSPRRLGPADEPRTSATDP